LLVVISGELALDVGLSEEEQEIWARLEMARVSVRIECPTYVLSRFVSLSLSRDANFYICRCKSHFPVDQSDYKSTSLLSCPISSCQTRWCKDCSQLLFLDTNSVDGHCSHECSGGAREFDEMMDACGWKRCPGSFNFSFLSCECISVMEYIGCDTPCSKEIGCNHVRCTVGGCNTYVTSLPPFPISVYSPLCDIY
jgi:hypothetical protein